MKIKKVIITIATVAILFGITSVSSLAATFNLDASFDGKTMKLSSNDLALDALNLLPGETDTSYINIANKGSKEVKLFMTANVIDDQDLLDALEISIKNSSNKELYNGGYDEFKKVEIALDKGETEKITIKTTLPETAGNEFQDKQANIKFHFEANGEEEVIPDNPKTNQSRIIIYSVLSGIVVILIISLIVLTINKKRKENNNNK